MSTTQADDSQLLRLAAPRAERLFEVFDRAEAFQPLLLVLAFLPGLIALQAGRLDESGALWALRALDLYTAESSAEFFDPGASVRRPSEAVGPALEGRPAAERPYRWAPPLGSWLTAFSMTVFGPDSRLGVVLVSFLCGGGTVLITWRLLRRVCDARTGLWAALLLACHPPFVVLLADPAPATLALLTALLAMWLFSGHLDGASGPVSWRLLGAGVALGLCVLAGGPLAVLAAGILLAWALLGASFAPPGQAARSPLERFGEALQSYGLMLLTAFAVGGWWVLMMVSQHGREFLSAWLSVPAGSEPAVRSLAAGDPSAWTALWHAAANLLVGLVALTVFGAWRSLRHAFARGRADEDAEPMGARSPAFPEKPGFSNRKASAWRLLIWTAGATAAWLALGGADTDAGSSGRFWQSFVLVPAVALAAVAVEEISHRRVSSPLAIGLLALTLVCFEHSAVSRSPDRDTVPTAGLQMPGGRPAVGRFGGVGRPAPSAGRRIDTGFVFAGVRAAMLAALIILASATVWITARGRGVDDRYRRSVLRGVVLTLVLVNSFCGLLAASRSTPDASTLAGFRNRLQAETLDIDAVVLIADEPSAKLRFLFRSIRPDVPHREFSSWGEMEAGYAGNDASSASLLVIVWGRDVEQPSVSAGPDRPEIGRPVLFEGRPLRAILVRGK